MNERPHPKIRVEDHGAVRTVTLDDPARRNCQTPSMWTALADLAENTPPQVRVVVLRGEGASFSAGLDRALFTAEGLPDEPNFLAMAARGQHEQVIEAIAGCQRGFAAWRECPAIVIAAVQGHAIGAGFQLALAADLRIVADDVGLVIAEPQLGLIPDLAGTTPLVRTLGYSVALEICATGRAIGAAEAVDRGLANLAVPRDALDDTVKDLVAALLQAPEAPQRALKPLLRAAEEASAVEQLATERQTQVSLLAALAAGARATR